jgi:CRISPR/Cas system-associated exonuclease Cas4 (RecB family)
MNKKSDFVRTKNIFDPNSKEFFKLSRSKIENFIECPRCFYLDRRLGIGRPSMPGFSLNSAVDALLKKEFDFHRVRGSAHPLMEKYGIDAVPFQNEKMDEWRENFKGVQYLHKPTNFMVTGAVDDLWINKKGEILVVDYKSTSTQEEINLEGQYKEGYKRQLEIYQWLLRQNGFKVSNVGYFVYANGKKDRKAFDGHLDFDVEIIKYEGDDSWVEKTIMDAHECLMSDKLPEPNPECEFCLYRKAAQDVEK